MTVAGASRADTDRPGPARWYDLTTAVGAIRQLLFDPGLTA